jgi:Rab11 family-interacting protein 1/2/5
MWSPTHVQVLVLQAKGLNVKGKHGTNDAFVTISLGKEKFQTSVKDKSSNPVEWNEQCELSIPSQGNTAEISLTVLHRNFLGVDEFLGQISLPLKDFDVYERPKSSWHALKCKPGKTKTEYRGELNVKIGFTVKANNDGGGSVADLRKKTKGSISSLNRVGGSISGSLMSISSKEKRNIKKFAKSVSHKVEMAKQSVSTLKLTKEKGGLESLPETGQWSSVDKTRMGREMDMNNQDPGVISDDEDDLIQRFSYQGSNQSISTNSSHLVERKLTNSSEKPHIAASKEKVISPETSAMTDLIQHRKDVTRSSVSHSSPTNQVLNDQGRIPQAKEKESREKEVHSGLPSYDEAVEQATNRNERTPVKKKIIPVQSDFDSSPSPENPSSQVLSLSPPVYQKNRFRMSQSSINLARQEGGELERKKKSLGLKLKSSYSFRDREDLDSELTQHSDELTNSQHSRTHSEGGSGPPKGPRIVPGRETSLTPALPHEVMSQYNGKSREDLIELLVSLESTVDLQARKIVDLEDYIDSLLLRVLEVAPILLKKDSPVICKNNI